MKRPPRALPAWLVTAACAWPDEMEEFGAAIRESIRHMFEVQHPELGNFLRGLQSPDLEQRADFEAIYDRIEDDDLEEALQVMRRLEHVDKAPGPKRCNDERKLIRMRRLVLREGFSVTGAALSLERNENHAKRLERAYMKRYSRPFRPDGK